MNGYDILILLLLALLVFLALRYLLRRKKQGKCCGCSGSGCSGSGCCGCAKKDGCPETAPLRNKKP